MKKPILLKPPRLETHHFQLQPPEAERRMPCITKTVIVTEMGFLGSILGGEPQL